MKPEYSEKQIQAFLDLMSEEVMSLSDEEIRARAKEEGVDIEERARIFRKTIEERSNALKLSRLHDARTRMQSQKAGAPALRGLSKQEMLERLKEVVASGLMERDSRLSLSFRSGQEVDEQDLRSLLEDYEELRARRADDPPEP